MARDGRGFGGRALAIAAALSLLLAGGIALHSARGDVPSPEHPAEQLVLRLHDLPPGFVPFSGFEGSEREFICEPLREGELAPKAVSFIKRFSPEGCWSFYGREYRIPGAVSPLIAGTGALEAGSRAGAASGFAVAPQLLSDFTEGGTRKVPAPEIVGDATQLFHLPDAPTLTAEEDQSGSFVVWRSRDVVAATFAVADSFATSDQIVFDLARRQQVHIENPTRYTRAERDTSEVGLDDPALKFPVRWLGRTFRPGHDLPKIRLEGSEAVSAYDRLPHEKLRLEYSRDVLLSGWTDRGWKRFLTSPVSRNLQHRKCTDSTEVAIPDGRATIFAAYGRDFEVCPDRPPRLYFALAYIGGTVTAVYLDVGATGPYNSLKGMKAIVRGLQLRPKPVYPIPARP